MQPGKSQCQPVMGLLGLKGRGDRTSLLGRGVKEFVAIF